MDSSVSSEVGSDVSQTSTAMSTASSLYEPLSLLVDTLRRTGDQVLGLVFRTCETVEKFAKAVAAVVLPPLQRVLDVLLVVVMPIWAFAVEYVTSSRAFLSGLSVYVWETFQRHANAAWDKVDLETRYEGVQTAAQEKRAQLAQLLDLARAVAVLQAFVKAAWEDWAMEEKLVTGKEKLEEQVEGVRAKVDPYWTSLKAKVAPHVPELPSPVTKGKELVSGLFERSSYPSVAPVAGRVMAFVFAGRDAVYGVLRAIPFVPRAVAMATPFVRGILIFANNVVTMAVEVVAEKLPERWAAILREVLATARNLADMFLVYSLAAFTWVPMEQQYSFGVSFAKADLSGARPTFQVSRREGRPVTVAVYNGSPAACVVQVAVGGQKVPSLTARVEAGQTVCKPVPESAFDDAHVEAPEFIVQASIGREEAAEPVQAEFALDMVWSTAGKKKTE